MSRFRITVNVDCTVSPDDVWPDGDAPSAPSVEDLERAFYSAGRSGDAVLRTLVQWGMGGDVIVDIAAEPQVDDSA